jgi:Concanavalin A-like lectin/glucanases superfamily
MPTAHLGRSLARAARIALPLAAVGAIVWAQVWHGATVLTLSAAHGIDAGDLLAVPVLLLALAFARRRPRAERELVRNWPLPASAVSLGVLLLLTGLLPGEGGPLVPAGGGTLDGAVAQTIGKHAVEVGRWTSVALTYDGAYERLYVDGEEVSREAATGPIQASRTPLWIGGNEPYGEHFAGLIDDIRVLARAQTPAEIRHDMNVPVARARGLVAAYAFDAGSGRIADDASGNHNAGTIEGATWAPGHFGGALRFDGASARVRVPASASLDLGRTLTLSAWIQPTVPQSYWRPIVQRQADAYFLAAGSGRVDRFGVIDDARLIPLVVAAAWFLSLIATVRAPRTAVRRRTWWLPVVLFALGSLLDAAWSPTVTLVGPLLVALWLAATATDRIEAACAYAAAAGWAILTLAAYIDLGGVAELLERFHAPTVRSAAIGALFVLAGAAARWGSFLPHNGLEHPSTPPSTGYEPPDWRS